ncbi:DUF1992 domain-containing protein [Musicola keenii]|uniref:DnaJ family domain-containing protein n=1 Tax=Musicola keenii TaxID=2884250 RepID=UPI001785D31E|nr:DUF1992 domain-containing protein [Musicola keenii]
MFPIDEWAERHIIEAQKKGELDNLSGSGKPLLLDDTSLVPVELRSAFLLMKNAGYLPQALLERKEALNLASLLEQITPQHSEYTQLSRQLRTLELRLQQAGMSTDFLRGNYRQTLFDRLMKNHCHDDEHE